MQIWHPVLLGLLDPLDSLLITRPRPALREKDTRIEANHTRSGCPIWCTFTVLTGSRIEHSIWVQDRDHTTPPTMFAINRGGGLICSAEQTPRNAQPASPPRRTPSCPLGLRDRAKLAQITHPMFVSEPAARVYYQIRWFVEGTPLGRDIDRHGSPLHWRNPRGWLDRLTGWFLCEPLAPRPRPCRAIHSARSHIAISGHLWVMGALRGSRTAPPLPYLLPGEDKHG